MRRAALAAGIGGAAALVCRHALSPRLASWGATRAESIGELPGDEVVAGANHQSTRAVEINAEPVDVWPWLVQMGQGRGGLYSYDMLQNLFRLDIHNADRVIPELQDLAVGDTVRLAPSGAGPKVRELEPGKHIVLEDASPAWTWVFTLRSVDESRTRLVARNRVSTTGQNPFVRLLYVALGPVVFIMERKMLLGIKDRAETLHAHSTTRERETDFVT